MCVKPGRSTATPPVFAVSGGGGAISEIARTRSHAVEPVGLHRTIADPYVERVGAEGEAVGERHGRAPGGTRAGQANARRRLGSVAERGSGRYSNRGPDDAAVESHVTRSRNTAASAPMRRVPFGAGHAGRHANPLETSSFVSSAVRIDDDVQRTGCRLGSTARRLRLADFVRTRRRRHTPIRTASTQPVKTPLYDDGATFVLLCPPSS